MGVDIRFSAVTILLFKVLFGLMVALRLTGLTNLLYEVANASERKSSLWPVYSRGLPLELTAALANHIHTISFEG